MPKSKTKSKTNNLTNATTRAILDFLLHPKRNTFAWRQNTLPVPVAGGGYRSGSKAGVSDIIGFVSDTILPGGRSCNRGIFLAIEVKTGRDKLREAQEVFLGYVKKYGGIVLVVKDFEDFERQWDNLTGWR